MATQINRVLAIVHVWLVLTALAFAQQETLSTEEITADLLLPIHRQAASEYTLYSDADKQTKLSFQERPVFVWTNSRRAGGQAGHLFLWKNKTRPLAFCSLFSHGANGVATSRRLVHEWHTLSESTLVVSRDGESPWKPQAGISFISLGATKPASESATRQKLEARRLAVEFDIHSIDREGQRWPLRVLTTPLCSYECDRGMGWLLAWVGDAGTDPELLMLVEPRESDGVLAWHYAPIRMTDHELFVHRSGERVWQSVRSEQDTIFRDAKDLYFRFPDKIVPLQ